MGASPNEESEPAHGAPAGAKALVRSRLVGHAVSGKRQNIGRCWDGAGASPPVRENLRISWQNGAARVAVGFAAVASRTPQ